MSTSFTLQFLRYSPDKVLQVKVTTARSKVKSRSDHDLAHLHPLTNVPTKHQLPTPYCFRDISLDKIFKLKVTTARSGVKSRSHHDVVYLDPPTNVLSNYQIPTPYGFRDTARANSFPPSAPQDTMGEDNTLTALKGCVVKNITS